MRGLDVLRQLWVKDAPTRTAPVVEPDTFVGNWLSPGIPRTPHFVAAAPRYYDYTTGVNYDSTPRSEFSNLTSFAKLWAFSKVATTPRSCISFRSRQMAGVPWEIIWRDEYGPKDELKVRRMNRLFEKPDQTQGWMWEQWLLAAMEEILVTDAWSLMPIRARGGGVAELMICDGQTFKPLHSYETGGRPLPPNPAYQQYITGLPYTWFTSDQLMYLPTRPRVNCTYGLSRLEAVYALAVGAVMYDNYWMSFFKEGNLPEVVALSNPDTWKVINPEEFRKWQEMQDKVSGLSTKRRRMHLAPPFIKDIKPVKEFDFKPELVQWLSRNFAIEFGVPFHLFVSETNRSTAKEVNEVLVEMPFRQDLMMLKRCMDEILTRAGAPDCEFVWRQPPDYRREAVDGIIMMVQNGVLSITEARRELGLETEIEQPEGSYADPTADPQRPQQLAVDRMPQVVNRYKAAQRLGVNPSRLAGPQRFKRAVAVDALFKPVLSKLDQMRREELQQAMKLARGQGKHVA